MTYNQPRALELLRLGTGDPTTTFRDGQEGAIQHVVEGRGRLLVVQKTGWGKSFVYFIAAKLLREQGAGPALLISPLLALMRNQIAAAERMGVRAATINSDNADQWTEVEAMLIGNEVDILLISPERFGNEHFRAEVLSRIAGRIALIVIDEAHCISDWGHDFRPHYRLIERIIRTLPPNLRVLATTATANNRVVADLENVLGPNLAISRGDLARPSLLLQTIRIPSQAGRMAWLATHLPRIPGSGIIYTLTVRDAVEVAGWLQQCGIAAEAYTGETGSRRPALENALLENRVKALVATTALGMGYDKPDLGFVIHYQAPGSVVAYYQQVGRAGRKLAAAYGILLSGDEETDINDYFIAGAFPSREEVQAIIAALEAAPAGLSLNQLLAQVNARRGRIDKALQLLSLESPAPVVKDGTRWKLTTTPIREHFWQRADRLTRLRREEQRQMQQYAALHTGHMQFLISALDGDPATCQSPAIAPLPEDFDERLAASAVACLRRTTLPLEPRKKWPPGDLRSLGAEPNTKIPPERNLQPGKILSVWGDAGWGELVRTGKYESGRFAEQLVEACVTLVQAWSPQPAITWVTCIPSRRHPGLVPDFASRLAAGLRLPFRSGLERIADRPPQKEMENSSQQLQNVVGAMRVIEPLPSGPVLLVDDMVDSKWTMTVAAYLLTGAGSGPVFPLALSSTAPKSE